MPHETQLAYRLKKLTNLDLALGNAIHRRAYELTTVAQQGKDLPTVDVMRRRTRLELGRLYRADAKAFRADPKNNPMLHGLYYHDSVDPRSVDRVREKLASCLTNLRTLDLWEQIEEWAVRVPFASDPDQYVNPLVHVDGVPVHATPDLVLQEEGQDLHVIVDWKTGQPRQEHVTQVVVYGLFVRHQFGAPECRGRLVYLPSGLVRDVEVTSEDLAETEAWIGESINEMRAMVADPEVNRARPKLDFPLAPDRWACRTCNYFELCEADLRSAGPLPWE